MIKIILGLFCAIASHVSIAQNTIDSKYKTPGQLKNNNALLNLQKMKAAAVDSLYLLHPEKQKSAYENMVDKKYEEQNAFNQKGNEVWIYEDILFNGNKKVLKVGNYNVASLGIFWNDKISSMLIPENMHVEVFINDNFEGSSKILNGWGLANIQHSSSETWIGAKPDIDVNDTRLEFFLDANQNKIANLNDNISSIKVKPGGHP